MKTGEERVTITDTESFLRSAYTHQICALFACGFVPVPGSFLDVIKPGPPEKRCIGVDFDNAQAVEFLDPKSGQRERVNPAEFIKRWKSAPWLAANPDHPIAYLKAHAEQEEKIRTFFRGRAPGTLITKGRRFALIYPDSDPEKRAKLLSYLES